MTKTTTCAARWCHSQVEQPTTGRRRRFCSDACKQMDYRERKGIRDREAARREAERNQEQYVRKAREVIRHALAGQLTKSQAASPLTKHRIESQSGAITRALELAGFLQPPHS